MIETVGQFGLQYYKTQENLIFFKKGQNGKLPLM